MLAFTTLLLFYIFLLNPCQAQISDLSALLEPQNALNVFSGFLLEYMVLISIYCKTRTVSLKNLVYSVQQGPYSLTFLFLELSYS